MPYQNQFLNLGLLSINRSGLETKFSTFKSAIELTENQKSQIITSHIGIRDILDTKAYVDSTFLTGSYKKNTIIKPVNDVDIFVKLTYSNSYEVTPQAVLTRMKKDIEASYPTSTVRQDKPCIVIDMKHCKFELTPAIVNAWGKYDIPLNNSQWISVDNPRDLENRLSIKNSQLNNRLVPLIKMMKKCKAKHNINHQSFQMEQEAINGLYSLTSYRDGVQQLLRIYGWYDNHPNMYAEIESKSDEQFGVFCREMLFGKEFPE